MTIDFTKMGALVPAIVQDASTRQVLMLGYMNEEAYTQTVATGLVTFYSRSRQTLWTKGESSGHYLHLVAITVDCDGDALLVTARPSGPTCHTGAVSCFAQTLVGEDDNDSEMEALAFLAELNDIIVQRKKELPAGSYTTSLFNKGVNRLSQKVGEEALEVVIESTNGTRERLVYECGDLLYHLLVLLTHHDVRLSEVAAELALRHKPGWQKH